MNKLPAIDSIWDYARPAQSEQAFRQLLAGLADDVDETYRAELLTQIARAQALQRRLEDADRTLDEAEAHLPNAPVRPTVRALLERGRIRNDLSETDRALALFAQARDLARSLGESALALDAEHMLGYVAPPAEAVRWNECAIETAQTSADPALRRWLGTLHMNLASKRIQLGHFEEARATYAQAARFRRDAGQDRSARDALAGTAKALRLGGRTEEALTVLEALLAEPETPRDWNGYIHEEAGECLLGMGRPEEAREHFAGAYPLLAADPWFPPTDTERLQRIRRLSGLDGN